MCPAKEEEWILLLLRGYSMSRLESETVLGVWAWDWVIAPRSRTSNFKFHSNGYS